jgi:hypothetical protein
VRFIENDRDRSLTFFKRRTGLYKAAAGLSTLTAARVVIVLESENGRFSSFGTPATDPIVDAFLSGKYPTGYTNEEQRGTITKLQNEVFYLEKDLVVEDKRKEESKCLVKELQESSWVAKFVFGKVEDLDVGEVHEMYRELSRLGQEIQLLFRTRHHGGQQDVGGRRDPSLLQPTWWRSLPLQKSLPSALPWTPMQLPTQLLPRSSHPAPTRSQSSIVNPMMLPPQQLPPRSLASSVGQLQAQRMSAPKQAIPNNNFRNWGMDINSNNSNLLFQSPMLPSPPSQPPFSTPQLYESSHHASPPQRISTPISVEGQLPFIAQNYYDYTELPATFTSPDATPAPSPTDKPYYTCLGGLNIDFGKASKNGCEIDAGLQRFGFSGGPQQGDGWIDEMISGSSSVAGNIGVGAGNNLLGGVNFPRN